MIARPLLDHLLGKLPGTNGHVGSRPLLGHVDMLLHLLSFPKIYLGTE